MVRKVTALLAALALLLLCGAALAEPKMVVDDAGLFKPGEVETLETLIRQIRDTYQVDAVVLTTRDTPFTSNDAKLVAWADRYYEENGYGLGEDRAGVIYMIDMNNRYGYLSTAGVMIDYLDQDRIDEVLDIATDYLRDGRYGRACERVLEKVKDYLAAGIREGHFRYDDVTGERLTGLYNRLTEGELGLAVLAGLAVFGLVCACIRGTYSLRGSTYRYDKNKNVQIELLHDDKVFLRQTVSRIRHSSGNGGGGHGGHGGGSGVHMSSGGMSHGGGGRHF